MLESSTRCSKRLESESIVCYEKLRLAVKILVMVHGHASLFTSLRGNRKMSKYRVVRIHFVVER